MRSKLLFKAARGNGKSMQAFEMVYGYYYCKFIYPREKNNRAIESRLCGFYRFEGE